MAEAMNTGNHLLNIHFVKWERCYNSYCRKLHLIDVGVPHLGEEPEGGWGVWIIYGELDPSLGHRTEHVIHLVFLLLIFLRKI